MIFAEVIIDISVKSLDRPFQYIVPQELLEEAEVGSLVKVPFGNGNRTMKGYIIGLSTEPAYDIAKTKSISEIVKQGVVAESHLLSLAYWIKENYGATMNDAIKVVLPVKQETKEKVQRTIYPIILKEEMQELKEIFVKKHYKAKVRVLECLLEQSCFEEGIDYLKLLSDAKTTAEVLRNLAKDGVIEITSKRQYRNPIQKRQRNEVIPMLNQQQQKIVETVTKEYRQGLRKTYLIHGVTGSGKTEVYMHIIEKIIADGKQVIMLIPEIALTLQTVNRFYQRFGERVSVMHSRLSVGERSDQFVRAKNGEIDIMIGPRSALFTPFQNLGLIVIDEEHESSYQSEMPPKYHAREVAIQRANMLGASVILGSATPSLEAYYRAKQGRYELFQLSQRAGGAMLPKVWITDLRQELEKKNRSIFGSQLAEMIEDRLQKKEQIMLFLNRRGYAGFVSCRKCGEVMQCPHCSVSLTAHMRYGKIEHLECHYCGYQTKMPTTCPSCQSKYIGTFGIGTQKVEEMAAVRFPGAKILRMDADTTKGKAGHEKILQEFAEGKADILVGTQMIVKGHDFENVTLVGILAADLSLNVGDYRAAERTYQLLAQAAGRAGRGKKPGDVVLQTYQPEHYSITCAASQDYVGFFEQELALRQMLQYPPVSNILGVLVLSENEESAGGLSERLAGIMKQYESVSVLGPTKAPLAKAKDVYREIVYVKCEDYRVLRQIKNRLEEFMNRQESYQDCRLQFNFNI